jgi:23S rRNA (pseudouridine1915-N3)-methyltransferase
VKLLVVAVGRKPPAWIRAGFEEYARRMPRDTRLTLMEIRPVVRPGRVGGADLQRMLRAEHRRIAGVLPAGCYKIVLDEGGRSFSTRQLAVRFARWREEGRDVAFVIGGADGTAPALRQEADLLWSLSPLTLPHGLARVVLAEQLYRTVSMLSGHPYHRD